MKTLIRKPRSTWNEFPLTFDDLFNDWATGSTRSHIPAVNVSEDADRYLIEVNAPGFDKNDFQINVDNDRLTISVEHKMENEDKSERYSRKEFEYHSFERSFKLPKDHVNENKIEAKYESGILKVTLPKAEEVKPKPARQIKIG